MEEMVQGNTRATGRVGVLSVTITDISINFFDTSNSVIALETNRLSLKPLP